MLFCGILHYFDSVDPTKLVHNAIALGFPLLELLLGIRMHLAPRFLVAFKVLSDPILPSISVLPGCAFAIPFTQALLKMSVVDVICRTPEASTEVYVDDFAQMSVGSLPHVVDALASAGVHLSSLFSQPAGTIGRRR